MLWVLSMIDGKEKDRNRTSRQVLGFKRFHIILYTLICGEDIWKSGRKRRKKKKRRKKGKGKKKRAKEEREGKKVDPL